MGSRSEWYLDNSDNLMRWSSIPNPLWYSIISYSYKNEEYHIRSSHIYGLLVSFQFVNTITNIGQRGKLIVKCFLINLFIDQLWYCVLIEFEAFKIPFSKICFLNANTKMLWWKSGCCRVSSILRLDVHHHHASVMPA